MVDNNTHPQTRSIHPSAVDEQSQIIPLRHALDVPELLAHIFTFLSMASRPLPRRSSTRPHERLGWVVVTAVNRRWRQTAFYTPQLWTKLVSSYSSDLIKAHIEHCGILPITMTIDKYDLNERAVDLFKPLVVRTRYLSVTADIKTGPRLRGIFDEPVPIFNEPAPVLESLYALFIHVSTLVLPTPLFRGNAPKLRSLKITCTGEITGLSFSGLQDLTWVSIIQDIPSLNPERNSLSEGLQAMHGLQSLILINCLPDNDPNEHSGAVFIFPRLTRLKLEDVFQRCAGLLKKLRTNSGIECITVTCSSFLEWPAESTVKKTMEHVFQMAATERPFRALSIQSFQGVGEQIVVRAWRRVQPWADTESFNGHGDLDTADLQVFVYGSPAGDAEILDDVCCGLSGSIQDIRGLNIDIQATANATEENALQNNTSPGPAFWRNFNLCPEVDCVVIGRDAAVGHLITALSVDTRQQEIVALFPRLRAVKLYMDNPDVVEAQWHNLRRDRRAARYPIDNLWKENPRNTKGTQILE